MKKTILNFSVLFLLAFFIQNVLGQDKIIKFQFSILDESGKFVSDLKTSDIQISQGKKTLRIDSIASKAESPLEVVIMIDSSASQEKMLPFEKKFAESIVDEILIKGKDKVAIVKFSGEVSLIQDLTDNLSQVKDRLKLIEFEPPPGFIGGGIVASQTPLKSQQLAKGSTSIWDSTQEVIKAFSKVKQVDSRRVIILISDGVNTFGESKFKEVIFSSLKYQVPIYAVGIGDDFYDGVDKKTLRKLTEQTSGILILPVDKQNEIAKQIQILKSGLHSAYEITFAANLTESEDTLQEFKVGIINPELRKKKLQIIQPKGIVLFDK